MNFKKIRRYLKYPVSEKPFTIFADDIALDLGTVNCLGFVPHRGIVLNEPSVVAVKSDNHALLAVGKRAKEMLGKTPKSIFACRPIHDGVIANYRLTESMLRFFIQSIGSNKKTIIGPRMVIAVPSCITQVEQRAVIDAAKQAGAREVYTIIEPMAAAIGAGLSVHDPAGSMIVDIGGGTTEVAVISLKDVVFCQSIRIGGDEMDQAIVQYVKRKYNLLVGEQTAEEVKMTIGSAMPCSEDKTMDIKGRDLVSGVPKTITLTKVEINEALLETIGHIVDVVRHALENTPPEIASTFVDTGIYMAGGGACLQGIDRLIAKETGLAVHIAENPLLCVVNGAGKVLNNLSFFKETLMG